MIRDLLLAVFSAIGTGSLLAAIVLVVVWWRVGPVQQDQ